MRASRRRHEAARWLSRVDRRLLLRVLAIGVSSFLIGYALTALLFFRGSTRPSVVTVPDVRENTVSTARRTLDRVGLELELGDSLPHPSVARGAVLAQSPLPGAEVGPGTAVRVILSAGRERRTVPSVDSLPRYQAERLLSGAGFQVVVREVPDPGEPGTVLGVDPPAGTVVELPADVGLLISGGPPQTEVPSLVGLHESEVPALLESAGLRLGEIRYQFGGFLRAGEVLDQSPAAGDSLTAGSDIDITVASVRSNS